MRIALSLFLCLVLLGLVAPDAGAQNAVLGGDCTPESRQLGALDFELGIRMITSTPYTIDVYDMDSGVRVSRKAVSNTSPTYGGCQWAVFFGDDTLGEGFAGRVQLPWDTLHRIDIYPTGGSGPRASYYHFQGNYCTAGSSFFCPRGNSGSTPDMLIFVGMEGGTQIRTIPIPLANGEPLNTSPYVEEWLSSEAGWVLPYDLPSVCEQYGCDPYDDNDYVFVTRIDPLTPIPVAGAPRGPLTFDLGYTGQGWRVPVGRTYNWSSSDVAGIRFGPLGKLTVKGTLNANGVSFGASNASYGWNGVRVEAGGTATLTNSVIEKAGTATIAAVTVAGGAFTLTGDQSRIRNSPGNAIYATGSTAFVLLDNRSRVQNNAGAGLYAENGAEVYVQGDAALIANGRGVRSRGSGTYVALNKASVTDNTGSTGLHSDYYGRIDLLNLSGPVTVEDNEGGLYSETAGSIDAVAWSCTMDPTFCTPAPAKNRFLNNSSGTWVFDAFTMDGGAVYAEQNFWGPTVTSSADLNLMADGWGSITVDPVLLTDPAPGGSLRQVAGMSSFKDSGDIRLGPVGAYASQVGRPGSVAGLVEAAERATAWGDDVLAALHLGAALDLASTGGETRAAWGATGRILGTTHIGRETGGRMSDAGAFGARVASHLAARLRAALDNGAERPWALRALAAGLAARGERAEAARMADALVMEADRFAPILPSAAKVPVGAGRRVPLSHAAFGHALRVRLASEAGDVAGAQAALAALVRTDASAAADVAFTVAAAFSEQDVSDVVDAARASAQGRSAVVGTAAIRAADAGVSRLAVVPNPVGSASGERARVAFEVAEAGPVSVVVFDALGRQVAVVAEGPHAAGPHTVALPLADLPAGVYVVRMVAETSSSPEQIVRRFSVIR